MNDIEIFHGNLVRKCIISEDGTTNYHIGLKRRHIVRILLTYKTRNRICVTDVRNDGIKCVTEKCVPLNCVMAGNYSYPSEEWFVLELLSSRAILASARPSCEFWHAWSHRRRNHPRQIFRQSVQGFLEF